MEIPGIDRMSVDNFLEKYTEILRFASFSENKKTRMDNLHSAFARYYELQTQESKLQGEFLKAMSKLCCLHDVLLDRIARGRTIYALIARCQTEELIRNIVSKIDCIENELQDLDSRMRSHYLGPLSE